MTLIQPLRRPILTALALVLAACGGDGGAAPRAPVAAVAVAGPDTLLLGDTVQFTAVLTDAGGRPLGNRSVTWSTPDTAMLSLLPDGRAIARDTGQLSVLAESEGIAGADTARALAIRFVQVSAGDAGSCAVDDGARVWCWGRQLHRVPSALADTTRYAMVGAGQAQDCGLTLDGDIRCWTDPAAGAAPDAVGYHFTDFTQGRAHRCARTADGTAWCWGTNGDGRLGTGSPAAATVPQPVADTAHYAQLSAGVFHTCGVTLAGVGKCWGGSGNGQLGLDTVNMALAPMALPVVPAFLQVTAGLVTSCGIAAADSTLWCWGDGNSGQLGSNRIGYTTIPEAVAGPLQATTAGEAGFSSCALGVDGQAWCWGLNDRGQAGTIATAQDSAPHLVDGGLTFTALSVGRERHACGLATGGVLYCWGENGQGELGVGGKGFRTGPAKVVGQR